MEKQIFKDPKTDDGIKKSQKGKVHVYRNGNKDIIMTDGHSLDSELSTDMLKPIFVNGALVNETTFAEIRNKLANSS